MAELMNIEETARYLRIAPNTLYQYGMENKIPGRVRICGKTLYDKEHLDRWILSKTEIGEEEKKSSQAKSINKTKEDLNDN